MIINGQNTEKSPGDSRRLAVTQTPVKKTSANAEVKSSNEWIIIIIKEGYFSDLEIFEMRQPMNKETFPVDPNTVNKTLNSEKKNWTRLEMPSNSNQNITHPNTTEKKTLTKEDERNVDILKRIMFEKKTILPSLTSQDWKTNKVETEK